MRIIVNLFLELSPGALPGYSERDYPPETCAKISSGIIGFCKDSSGEFPPGNLSVSKCQFPVPVRLKISDVKSPHLGNFSEDHAIEFKKKKKCISTLFNLIIVGKSLRRIRLQDI